MCRRLLANPVMETADWRADGQVDATSRAGERVESEASAPRSRCVVFPGTWSERDFAHVAGTLGWDAAWCGMRRSMLGEADAVVLPGGFAHGDHLRTGAIARFSPVMARGRGLRRGRRPGDRLVQWLPDPVRGRDPAGRPAAERPPASSAATGSRCASERAVGPWLGELAAGDVDPAARSRTAKAVTTPMTRPSTSSRPATLVALRYADDARRTSRRTPTRTDRCAASPASSNERGNVLGLMPHPERAAEAEVGGTDGLRIFRSLATWLARQPAAAERRL